MNPFLKGGNGNMNFSLRFINAVLGWILWQTI